MYDHPLVTFRPLGEGGSSTASHIGQQRQVKINTKYNIPVPRPPTTYQISRFSVGHVAIGHFLILSQGQTLCGVA